MNIRNYIRLLGTIIVTNWPSLCHPASLTLLDSSFNEMVAYFSSLTDNIYIQEFETSQTFSVTRDELDDKQKIHQLFVELVANAGGRVEELGRNTFKIVAKDKASEVIDTIKVDTPEIKRITLQKKIGILGIKALINADNALKSLKVIEESTELDYVLLYGLPDQLALLQALIDSLPKAPEIKEERVAEISVKPELDINEENIPKYVTEVFGLNYADASEVTENLKSVLSSELYSISIAPHASANQVIVSGVSADVEIVLDILRELDRVPRQVYLDAIIAEVSEETAAKLGLQFSINSENLAASVVTGVNGVNIGAAAGDAFLAGAAGGILAAGRGANLVPDIGLMLSALEGDTDNRILATPSLMATENRESTILVGQNVPFITGRYTNDSGNGTAPFQTIKREDLGTSLKLKPKIGSNGAIVMEIWQEVSRIDQSAPGLSDVVTVKRQISTVVSAMQGETIAIGGLKIEQQELGVTKVPLLGDIPIFGNAFRQETTKSVSRNLAIFLRPTLVSDANQRKKVYKVWQKSLGSDLKAETSDKSNFFKLDKRLEASDAIFK